MSLTSQTLPHLPQLHMRHSAYLNTVIYFFPVSTCHNWEKVNFHLFFQKLIKHSDNEGHTAVYYFKFAVCEHHKWKSILSLSCQGGSRNHVTFLSLKHILLLFLTKGPNQLSWTNNNLFQCKSVYIQLSQTWQKTKQLHFFPRWLYYWIFLCWKCCFKKILQSAWTY